MIKHENFYKNFICIMLSLILFAQSFIQPITVLAMTDQLSFLSEDKIIHNGSVPENIILNDGEYLTFKYLLNLENPNDYNGKSFKFELNNHFQALDNTVSIDVEEENGKRSIGNVQLSGNTAVIKFNDSIIKESSTETTSTETTSTETSTQTTSTETSTETTSTETSTQTTSTETSTQTTSTETSTQTTSTEKDTEHNSPNNEGDLNLGLYSMPDVKNKKYVLSQTIENDNSSSIEQPQGNSQDKVTPQDVNTENMPKEETPQNQNEGDSQTVNPPEDGKLEDLENNVSTETPSQGIEQGIEQDNNPTEKPENDSSINTPMPTPITATLEIKAQLLPNVKEAINLTFGNKEYSVVKISKDENLGDFESLINEKSVYRSDEKFNPVGEPLKNDEVVSLKDDLIYQVKALVNLSELNKNNFSFVLPTNTKIVADFKNDIDVDNYKNAVTMTANKSKQRVEIAFNDNFPKEFPVNLTFDVSFKLNVKDDFKDETIDIPIESKDIVNILKLRILETQPKESEIKNTVEKNNNFYDWDVVFDKGQKGEPPKFVETTILDSTQILVPDSVKIDGVKDENLKVSRNTDNTGTVIRYDIPENHLGESKITYKTVLSDEALSKKDETTILSNPASLLNPDNKVLKTADAQIKVPPEQKRWITKNGQYIPESKKINWEIKVKTNGRKIKNLKIYDSFQEKLKLDDESLKLDGKTITPNYEVKNEENIGTKFYVNVPEENGAYKDEYTLTYSTNVDPSLYEVNENNKNLNFENSAYLKFDWLKTVPTTDNGEMQEETFKENFESNLVKKSVAVETAILKLSSSYDRATHEITWIANLNDYTVDIKSGKIQSTLPTGDLGHTLIKDSFSSSSDITLDNSSTENKLLIDVGNLGPKKATFTFKTLVTNPKNYAYNTSPKDYSINLDFTGVVDDRPEQKITNVTGKSKVFSEVIKKESENYTHSNNNIIWKITVNQNKMPMKNAVIVDVLKNEHDFVENSVTVDGVEHKDYTYDKETKTIKINLGDIAVNTQPKVIKFNTKLDVDAIDKFKTPDPVDIFNTATLTRDEYDPLEVKAKITLTNEILQKDGELNKRQGNIKYTVGINPHKLTLGKEGAPDFVVDTLPKGLRLDIDSVSLTKATASEDGKEFTKISDGKVELTLKQNFIYNAKENSFKVVLPIGAESYVLEYITDITDERLSPFKNVIKFNIGANESSGSGDADIDLDGSGSGSGSIVYPKGSVTIKDLDEIRKGVVLPGVKFELYDKKYDILLEEATTDESGTLKFSSLKTNYDYIIKEVENPNRGYIHKENIEYSVKLEPKNKDIVLECLHTPKKSNLTFKNKDNYENLIPNTEYTIVDQTKGSKLSYTKNTDTKGEILIENVPFGNYLIKEKRPNENYVANRQEYVATINESGEYEGIRKKGSTELEVDNIIKSIEKTQSIIIKKINSKTKEPIQNVKFKINGYGQDKTLSTNKQGQVVFEGLKRNEIYTITETPLPEESGYTLITQPVSTIRIEKQDKREISQSAPNIGKIEFEAKDDWDRPRKDLTFEIIKKPEIADPPYKIEVSANEDGKVIVEEVPFGDYEIRVKNPSVDENFLTPNYKVNIDTQGKTDGIKNLNGISANAIVSNKKETSLTIKKVDKITGVPVVGVKVEILDENGNVRFTGTTNEKGEAIFNNVKRDETYTVVETNPDGYTSERHTVIVGKEPTKQESVSVPTQNSVIFPSKDDWGRPLPGVDFVITNPKTGFTQKVTSDKNGDVIFIDVPFGDYIITVGNNLPENIQKSNESYKVSMAPDGTVSPIKDKNDNEVSSISNIKEETSLTIKKVDEITGLPIPNVKVEIIDSSNKVRFTGTTNEKGEVVFSGAKKDEVYTVVETPSENSGYEQIRHQVSVGKEPTEQKSESVPTKNTIIFPSKDDWGRLLPGVDFIITNPETKVTRTATSDENGNVIFTDVPFGDYIITVGNNLPENIQKSKEEFYVSISPTGDVSKVKDKFDTVIDGIPNKKEETSLTITKVDEITGKPIVGAKIEIFDSNGVVRLTGTTGENGQVVFENIKKNESYIVKETNPAGYTSSEYDINIKTESVQVESDSIPTQGNITFTSKDDWGRPLPGVDFIITNPETGFTQKVTSDKDGNVIFTDVPFGDYEITVAKTPTNIEKSENKFNVSISTSGQTSNITDKNGNKLDGIPNKKEETKLTITKVDKVTGIPIPGVKVEIVDSDGITRLQGVTNENGQVVFENIKKDETYTIKETNPDGYTSLEHQVKVEKEPVEDKSESVPTEGTIIFPSKDDWGRPLPGVDFVITNPKTGFTQIVTSDKNGHVIFTDVPFGDYIISIGKNVPENIEKSNQEYKVSISTDGVSSDIKDKNNKKVDNISNKKEEVTVTITKIDEETKKPIPGFVVEIYDETGKKVKEGITDENGQIQFQLKKDEKYEVVELNKPGYKPLGKYKLEVGKEDKQENSSSITIKHNVKINTRDQNDSPVSDVKFDIFTEGQNIKTDKPIRSGITSKDGVIKIENVPMGEYTIIQKPPKNGNYADEEIIYKIVVDAKGKVTILDINNNKLDKVPTLPSLGVDINANDGFGGINSSNVVNNDLNTNSEEKIVSYLENNNLNDKSANDLIDSILDDNILNNDQKENLIKDVVKVESDNINYESILEIINSINSSLDFSKEDRIQLIYDIASEYKVIISHTNLSESEIDEILNYISSNHKTTPKFVDEIIKSNIFINEEKANIIKNIIDKGVKGIIITYDDALEIIDLVNLSDNFSKDKKDELTQYIVAKYNKPDNTKSKDKNIGATNTFNDTKIKGSEIEDKSKDLKGTKGEKLPQTGNKLPLASFLLIIGLLFIVANNILKKNEKCK